MGFNEDLVYLQILVVSFAATFVVKRCSRRDLVGGLFGLFLVFFICRIQGLHSLIVVLMNLLIINFVNFRRLHWISFAFCFSYITFFRCTHLLGLPKALPYSNAVQLIMTLRCVGLAFEIREAKMNLKKDDETASANKKDVVDANFLEQFLYCFNFIGLFTGPYFSFRVHLDNVYCPYLLHVNYANHITPRILMAPCFIVLLLIADSLFPLEAVHTDEFYETTSFLYRFFYMVPTFFHLRMRCYVAWSLSECACIVAGIGCYPKSSKPKCGRGPTDLIALNEFGNKTNEEIEETEFCFETIRNVDPAGCEFAGTFREAMRYWNRSVQYWLATYIYRQSPRAYRTAITMLVSAYWHGIHPGYYLSFMTIPLCLYVEDLMFSCFGSVDDEPNVRTFAWDSRLRTKFEKLWWFFRVRGFEYMSMGFLLLSWTSTVRYWSSIGFALHSSLLVMFVVAKLMQIFGMVQAPKSGKEYKSL